MPKTPPTLDTRRVRRLALIRAGLLRPDWTSLPQRASGHGLRARKAAHTVVDHFGYLQLDSIPVTGARTHGLVLASRLEGFDARFAEQLLQPEQPFFEYWGHEACWLPMGLYPVFAFRRQEYQIHPWWGDLLGEHPKVADRLLERMEHEGPLRSKDLEGGREPGSWWHLGIARKVLAALWTAGHVCVSERRGFQRFYDLTERVIPESYRERPEPLESALETLTLKALDGHGWATTGTLVATWRLSKYRRQVEEALRRLEERGEVTPCFWLDPNAAKFSKKNPKKVSGWIRIRD